MLFDADLAEPFSRRPLAMRVIPPTSVWRDGMFLGIWQAELSENIARALFVGWQFLPGSRCFVNGLGILEAPPGGTAARRFFERRAERTGRPQSHGVDGSAQVRG
jgi:hypothetical protein